MTSKKSVNILTILAMKQKVLANEMTQQMNPKAHTEALGLGADANLISCQESDEESVAAPAEEAIRLRRCQVEVSAPPI